MRLVAWRQPRSPRTQERDRSDPSQAPPPPVSGGARKRRSAPRGEAHQLGVGQDPAGAAVLRGHGEVWARRNLDHCVTPHVAGIVDRNPVPFVGANAGEEILDSRSGSAPSAIATSCVEPLTSVIRRLGIPGSLGRLNACRSPSVRTCAHSPPGSRQSHRPDSDKRRFRGRRSSGTLIPTWLNSICPMGTGPSHLRRLLEIHSRHYLYCRRGQGTA